MTLSAPIPPRNRLLALEQELRARRPVVVQQTPTQPSKTAQTMGTQAEAASATLASTPSPHLIIPPPHHRRAPAPKIAPPLSPWQLLAARLTQRSLPDYGDSFPEPDLAPPPFPPTSTNFAQEQSLPPFPFPPRPIARAPHPTVSPHPAIPSRPQDNQEAPISEDAVPLTSWKDLADQIQQARSPSVQQNQTSSPSVTFTEASALSVSDTQATVEMPEPQPSRAEQWAADHPSPPDPPQAVTDSAPSLEVIAEAKTDQPALTLQAEHRETREQDCEDISTIDISATTVGHSKPFSNAPVEAVTETAIVPIVVPKNDGALLPHSPPNWAALANSLMVRAGPPKIASRSIPKLPPGSTP